MDRVACPRIAADVLPDQNEKRQQSFFMPRRLEQPHHVLQRQVAIFACDCAELRNRDTEKLIAGPVLARSGFEKPLVIFRALRTRDFSHVAPYRPQRRAYPQLHLPTLPTLPTIPHDRYD